MLQVLDDEHQKQELDRILGIITSSDTQVEEKIDEALDDEQLADIMDRLFHQLGSISKL